MCVTRSRAQWKKSTSHVVVDERTYLELLLMLLLLVLVDRPECIELSTARPYADRGFLSEIALVRVSKELLRFLLFSGLTSWVQTGETWPWVICL